VNEQINGPNDFNLYQNYPNPFNPSTKIQFALTKSSKVLLRVYDVTGHEVSTLVNETKSLGEYEISFNAADLPSGIYFYNLSAGNFTETKKMLLLK